jgi:hypothetical protein
LIGRLKEKGFVTVTVRNMNERVIRTAGKWRRISVEEIASLRAAQGQLVHNMDLNRSGGVGRKVPGR